MEGTALISINSISTTADTTTTITEQALDKLPASGDTAAAPEVSVHALSVAPSVEGAPNVHHATLSAPAAHRHYEALSRGLNFLLAAAILVVFSPVWLLIALAIKLSSPGPVFYTRTVIGRDATPFTYYKFRTMRVNNDDSTHRAFLEQYVKENKPFTVERDAVTGEERPVFKVVGDPRVTAIGRVLRRLSLDEIPQLLNVLRGEMNLVGPRPPIEFEYHLYDNTTMARLAVRPGLTGLAQVRGRGKLSFAEMVAHDIEYVRQRSLVMDLKIMAATFMVLFKGE